MESYNIGAHLIGASIPMNKKDETLAFYSGMLGMKAGRALSSDHTTYHLWGSSGVKLVFAVVDPGSNWVPGIMLNFRVNDLSHAQEVLESFGGKKIYGPFPLVVDDSAYNSFKKSYEDLAYGSENDVTQEMGQCIVAMDPSGNRIILSELESYAERFFEGAQITRHQKVEHAAGLKNAEMMK